MKRTTWRLLDELMGWFGKVHQPPMPEPMEDALAAVIRKSHGIRIGEPHFALLPAMQAALAASGVRTYLGPVETGPSGVRSCLLIEQGYEVHRVGRRRYAVRRIAGAAP